MSDERRPFPLGEDLHWLMGDAFSSVIGAAWLPRSARKSLLRLLGADARSAPGIKFYFAGRPRLLTIGTGCFFNRGVYVELQAQVTIGDACAFGMEAMLITSTHPIGPAGWATTSGAREINIGDRVWVGARAVILPGTVIEDDVIIAAGAVVTGICRSGGIYGGVPARRIGDSRRHAIEDAIKY